MRSNPGDVVVIVKRTSIRSPGPRCKSLSKTPVAKTAQYHFKAHRDKRMAVEHRARTTALEEAMEDMKQRVQWVENESYYLRRDVDKLRKPLQMVLENFTRVEKLYAENIEAEFGGGWRAVKAGLKAEAIMDLGHHLMLPYPFPGEQDRKGDEWVDGDGRATEKLQRLKAIEAFAGAFYEANIENIVEQKRAGQRIKGTFVIRLHNSTEALEANAAVVRVLEEETRRYSGMTARGRPAVSGSERSGERLLVYRNKTQEERDRKRYRTDTKEEQDAAVPASTASASTAASATASAEGAGTSKDNGKKGRGKKGNSDKGFFEWKAKGKGKGKSKGKGK